MAEKTFTLDIVTPTQNVFSGQVESVIASGTEGYLLSSAFKWFGLSVPDERLMDDRQVRMWLSHVEQVLYGLIRRSNFYRQMVEMFMDGGSFGTATMFMYWEQKWGFSIR